MASVPLGKIWTTSALQENLSYPEDNNTYTKLELLPPGTALSKDSITIASCMTQPFQYYLLVLRPCRNDEEPFHINPVAFDCNYLTAGFNGFKSYTLFRLTTTDKMPPADSSARQCIGYFSSSHDTIQYIMAYEKDKDQDSSSIPTTAIPANTTNTTRLSHTNADDRSKISSNVRDSLRGTQKRPICQHPTIQKSQRTLVEPISKKVQEVETGTVAAMNDGRPLPEEATNNDDEEFTVNDDSVGDKKKRTSLSEGGIVKYTTPDGAVHTLKDRAAKYAARDWIEKEAHDWAKVEFKDYPSQKKPCLRYYIRHETDGKWIYCKQTECLAHVEDKTGRNFRHDMEHNTARYADHLAFSANQFE